MRKIIVLICAILVFIQLHSVETGKFIFPQDAAFYASSKGINILKENIAELNYLKYVLTNYFENNSLLELDPNDFFTSEYDVAVYQKKDKNLFVIIKQMTTEEYMQSRFYNNKMFKNVLQSGYSIYFSGSGDAAFYYSYFGDSVYISNDSDIFFQTLGNIKDKKKTLDGDIDFKLMMNKREEYEYKIMTRVDESGKLLDTNQKTAIYVKDGNLKKFYSGVQQQPALNINAKTVDFAEFVADDLEKVYVGRNIGKYVDVIERDLALFKYSDFEEFVGKIKPRVGNFIIGENKKYFYLVCYSDTNIDQEMKEAISREYEKAAFLWGRKFNIIKNGDYGAYFELPYIGMKRYMGVVKNKYFVFTNNPDYIKNFYTAKYYNLTFSKIDVTKEYDVDMKAKK